MSALSLRRDFKRVQWLRTVWLNVLRAFSAGVVWAAVILVSSFGNTPTPAHGAGPAWYAVPFTFTIAYLFVLPLFWISAKVFIAMTGGIGELGVWLTTIVFGVAIAVGDPLVFALHQVKPTLVPTERFRPLNLALVVYVLDPEKMGLD